MIIDIIGKYSEIIAEYDIIKFRVAGSSYELIGKIRLINHTQLFFKDYLFSDGSRKYSFHWQDVHSNCIVRWDNAPHHQNVSSFPYHKHIGKQEDIVESHPMKLESVLEYIREDLKNKI
jgi:hypothetical protein